MSFLHPIYVGHFERDGNFVRFSNTSTDPILRPVVSRPIEMDTVKRLAEKLGVQTATVSMFPENWSIWLEDGYLAADRNSLNPDTIQFITQLKQATDCDLVDFNARSTIEVAELQM